MDGVRLQGTYSGTTGLQYTPDAHALRPSSFAFGHSPWSRPSLVTDAYIKDVKLWATALDAAQVEAEIPSPISPLHLPHISPTSPLYLPYISPISPLYLPYISPHLERGAQLEAQQRVGREGGQPHEVAHHHLVGRCRGGAGEVQGRCREGAGEMQGR